jgi:predicted aspartyl protease
MPLIQGLHNGRAATIQIAIIDVAKRIEHKESNDPVLKGVKPFRALIDTGATSTMIASRVVAQLGLQQVNKLPFDGMGGISWRRAYLFHVAFYEAPPSEDSALVSKIHICRKTINGGELSDEHTFDVLLGMDILTTGHFRVDRDGTFSFSF